MPKVRNPSKLWTHFVRYSQESGELAIEGKPMRLFPGERQKRQAVDYGPVTLVWSGGPSWRPSDRAPAQHLELYVRNAEALARVSSLVQTTDCVNPFIMDHTGNVIWSEHELRSVCEKRKAG